MLKSRRRAAIAITAASSVVSMIAVALPAQAVALSDWPAAGRAAAGCATVTPAGPFSDWTVSYTDTLMPSINNVFINGGTYVIVPPAGRSASIQVAATEPCGGIGFVTPYPRIAGSLFPSAGVPVSDNAFSLLTASAYAFNPSDAGIVTVPLVQTNRRYDAFMLDKDFKLLGTPTATAATAVYMTGDWSTKKLYVLRQTTLTNTASKTIVPKATAVKFTAVLRYAINGAWAADNGEKVIVQTKVGTRAWTTRATLLASSAGIVSYTFKPTAATFVRFVHAAVLTGRFTASIVSPIRVIRVS